MASKFNKRSELLNKLKDTDINQLEQRKSTVLVSPKKNVEYLIKNNSEGMLKLMHSNDHGNSGKIDKTKFNKIMSLYGLKGVNDKNIIQKVYHGYIFDKVETMRSLAKVCIPYCISIVQYGTFL